MCAKVGSQTRLPRVGEKGLGCNTAGSADHTILLEYKEVAATCFQNFERQFQSDIITDRQDCV
jgi:hypothetical protein